MDGCVTQSEAGNGSERCGSRCRRDGSRGFMLQQQVSDDSLGDEQQVSRWSGGKVSRSATPDTHTNTGKDKR